MRRLLSSAAVAVILLAAGSAIAAPTIKPAASPTFASVTTQLPRNVRPSHYDVAFTPDADKMSFVASVKIAIEVVEPTSVVTLQAADLTFDKASIAGIGAAKIKTDEDAQTATFTFDKPLAKGKYVLAIDYAGKIYTQAAGLFALDYETETGKKRALYTQFENSDARRFVPSWDEPFYKATFGVEAVVPTGQMALGNMPIEKSTDLGGGKTRVKFATSPKMSTYLLFFGLGEFERATVKSAGVDIGVVTKTGDTGQGRLRPEVGGRPPALVQRLFRHALSAAGSTTSPRPAAASSSAPWRTGARSSPSNTPCCWIRRSRPRPTPAGLHHRGPRNGPPVVRRPGHHGLVGRPVAERGLRVVDGEPGHRALPSRVERRPDGASAAANTP
jgi:hypothetical protein